ncbi:MAG: hypothetical protein WCP98_11180 [Actinomycetes bacterium]
MTVDRAKPGQGAAAGFIANTDFGWFSHFLHRAEPPDEVDFWQPSSHGFRAIPPGAPFFFRLGAPHKAIAGFGFFARYERVPAWLAWDSFGDKNGTDTFAEMAARIESIRHRTRSAILARPQDYEVGRVPSVPSGRGSTTHLSATRRTGGRCCGQLLRSHQARVGRRPRGSQGGVRLAARCRQPQIPRRALQLPACGRRGEEALHQGERLLDVLSGVPSVGQRRSRRSQLLAAREDSKTRVVAILKTA